MSGPLTSKAYKTGWVIPSAGFNHRRLAVLHGFEEIFPPRSH